MGKHNMSESDILCKSLPVGQAQETHKGERRTKIRLYLIICRLNVHCTPKMRDNGLVRVLLSDSSCIEPLLCPE